MARVHVARVVEDLGVRGMSTKIPRHDRFLSYALVRYLRQMMRFENLFIGRLIFFGRAVEALRFSTSWHRTMVFDLTWCVRRQSRVIPLTRLARFFYGFVQSGIRSKLIRMALFGGLRTLSVIEFDQGVLRGGSVGFWLQDFLLVVTLQGRVLGHVDYPLR